MYRKYWKDKVHWFTSKLIQPVSLYVQQKWKMYCGEEHIQILLKCFCTILHIAFALMFTYCRHKSSTARLIIKVNYIMLHNQKWFVFAFIWLFTIPKIVEFTFCSWCGVHTHIERLKSRCKCDRRSVSLSSSSSDPLSTSWSRPTSRSSGYPHSQMFKKYSI